MSGVSSKELEKIFAVVDEASLNHTKWHDDLVRRLLCHLPLSESIVAKDAHHLCAFGTWFYGMGKDQVNALLAFKRIGELHQAMHNSAREVCIKSKATGFVPEVDYDAFVQDLALFRNEIVLFKSRIVKTLENAGHP
ncbi:MAG: CZB domain-containing protein [Pseudomonadota bacterium]